MNRSYLNINADLYIGKVFNITIDQKYFYLYALSMNTKSYYDYVGWYEIGINTGFDFMKSKVIDDFAVYCNFFTGGDKFYDEDKLSLSCGLKSMFVLGPKFHPSIYIEYYRGYAEQMISYTEFDNIIRFGLGFN